MVKPKNRIKRFDRDDSLTVREKQIRDRARLEKLLGRPLTHRDVQRILNQFQDVRDYGYVR